jgi:hypothetical protein
MAGTGSSTGRAWGIAIVVGLAVAAALLVIPPQALFEPKGRDACEEIDQEYVGLANGGGRYADPVPDGARCVGLTNPAVTEIEVDFFASSEPLDSLFAWLYRLACILLPISVGIALGFRLSRT